MVIFFYDLVSSNPFRNEFDFLYLVDYSLRSFGFCQNRDCGKKKSAPTSTESRSQSVLSNIVLFTILPISKKRNTYSLNEPNLMNPNCRISVNLWSKIYDLRDPDLPTKVF